MTLKRYLLVLMAALAVFACSPGVDLDDNTDDPQEQNDPQDDGTDDSGDDNGNTSDDNGNGADDNGGDNNGGGDDNGGEGGEGGEQQSSQPGWFELPVVNASRNSDGYLVDVSNPDLYYAYHKSDIGTRNYTVCYNGAYHCAVWVAAPRHAIYSQKVVGRQDTYKPDPDIPESVQQQAKSAGSGCDYNRGHMLGSEERLGSKLTNDQVFYYSNIAPQNKTTFNTGGGGWNNLEEFVDKFQCADTLYIVIGTYFEDFTDAYGCKSYKKTATFMGSEVQIPTMFYYALLRTKSGSSGKSLKDCSRDEIMCAAFVRAHDITKGQKVTAKEMMTIDKLEELTGFDYFQAVPNAPEDTFTASDWGL